MRTCSGDNSLLTRLKPVLKDKRQCINILDNKRGEGGLRNSKKSKMVK